MWNRGMLKCELNGDKSSFYHSGGRKSTELPDRTEIAYLNRICISVGKNACLLCYQLAATYRAAKELPPIEELSL
jgi:hypothetical protein